MLEFAVGIVIFVTVFYLIISERVPGAWATMIGGLLMALVGITNEEQALEAVGSKLEIIFLLIGMMVIVHYISETGVFQWFAIKVAQLVRGEPFYLIVLLAVVTALFSAFLDNVTTILLMAPVSILLANQLQQDPFPFVITEIMAANIGGVATLIGDPTQLIIGYEGKLGFNQFLSNTAPVSVLAMIILLLNVYFIYGRKMEVSGDLKARIMNLDPGRSLKDKQLLKEAGVIFIFVILGFILNNFIDKGLAVIALTGAIALVVIAKKKPEEVFHHVEWDTLFFFIGLFMLVKGLDEIHLSRMVGQKLIELTAGKFELAAYSLAWISAFFTSIIGNVANAAMTSQVVKVMIPSFKDLGNPEIFWWALSFGSCLGGNMTILGSATNVVAVGAATKAGCRIDFMKFMKFGALISIQTVLLANIYMWIRYF